MNNNAEFLERMLQSKFVEKYLLQMKFSDQFMMNIEKFKPEINKFILFNNKQKQP